MKKIYFGALSLLLCALSLSCGGNGNAPIQTASIAIRPTSASLQALSEGRQKQQFQALVTGTASNVVMWLVNGIAGGNQSVGTITSSGLYTAPNEVPGGIIIVTATIAATNLSSNSAIVKLLYPPAAVTSVAPPTIMQGSGTTTVTLIGGPFSSAAMVDVNGNPEPATAISITQLATTISGTSLASPGTLSLNASNPVPGGGSGDPVNFYVVPGAYVRVGDLNVARYAESATLLPDGKVLVAGGNDVSGNALSSTEIFDPQTNLFQMGPDMTSVRGANTAILMNNGKVLVAGGSASSADLYDPLTETFTAISPPGFPVDGLATLLSNGQVLLQSYAAELYDPASNVFTQVPSANIPDPWPPDGSAPCIALPAGENVVFFGSTYYFHPSTMTYTPASVLGYWLGPCVVTALNDGRFFIIEGPTWGHDFYLYFVRDIWDPQSDTAVGYSSQFARGESVAVRLQSGRVLIVGGAVNVFTYTPFAPYPDEVFDPAIGSSFVAPFPLLKRRFDNLTAVLLQDGRVLVLNGEDDGSTANVIAETYVPPGTVIKVQRDICLTQVTPMGCGLSVAAG